MKQRLILFFNRKKEGKRVTIEEYRDKTFRSAMAGLGLNILFAVFYAVLGIVIRSAWFGTLAAYYILLAVMQWNIIKCNEKVSAMADAKERIPEELAVYKKGGISFLIMTIVLMGAVVLLLTVEEGKSYPGFTIYAVATYTFYRITMSIIHVIKTRKMKSVLLMAVRDVGYVESLVSMLILQTALISAFGDGNLQTAHLMNGLTGGGVCLLVLATGVNEIVQSVRLTKKHREKE